MSVQALIFPEGYRAPLSVMETQVAIKLIKDTFERELAQNLNLTRVSAPLFVTQDSGLNDNLNGVERPVSFDIRDAGSDVEIVHSLAKWKRVALKKYGFGPDAGLYTDMNAIRRDEVLDNLHSVYVDQWDWEKVITRQTRNEYTLRETVNQIVDALYTTQQKLCEAFPQVEPVIASEIAFVTTQELEDRWPDRTPKEREDLICREKKLVFLQQIGGKLRGGEPHDGRAPDYDDWSLNGDILVWYPLLERALEISSMGIRVDREALLYQLAERKATDRVKFPFHRMLIDETLPLTIGGGIGQSRICMLLLQKAHIGEVQASVWPEEDVTACARHGIHLL
ncbi:aspartate--ammonia ligase [Acetanaerobacterium sp. MSJ-12]|uniref:Aspartate--ammonia ligase n=1 Tax=Bittarella massiliensis (ex Durand et al. 2017) TaxID=1720313 RepID=A0AAW5K9T1_9FIRM|nr:MULTISPECIES: aspartate--ammonia ligase [Oscillospiraceae]MBC2871283.1 aspartate--ammonia ligase [Bittarella massiliensis (ex Durand et al. 2017)]MBU5419223.1 aspartate--ammonia ligase [Acetanaerobacterium sp. MSJ-12]MCQ4949383.1 aspartate--ammonia ligase [Bittarella massiliensis (ex Durand et al. 2017)]